MSIVWKVQPTSTFQFREESGRMAEALGNLLFFFIMKLSVLSRLCLTHKRVIISSKHRVLEILVD